MFAQTVSQSTQTDSSSTTVVDDHGKKKATEEAKPAESETTDSNARVIDDVYQTLMTLGLTPLESRNKLDALLQSGARFKTVQDALSVIYGHGK